MWRVMAVQPRADSVAHVLVRQRSSNSAMLSALVNTLSMPQKLDFTSPEVVSSMALSTSVIGRFCM